MNVVDQAIFDPEIIQICEIFERRRRYVVDFAVSNLKVKIVNKIHICFIEDKSNSRIILQIYCAFIFLN